MKLNKNYRASIQDRNVVLERYVVPTEKTVKGTDEGTRVGTGEFTKASWELIGYYPNHQAMLRGFVAVEMRNVPQNIAALTQKVDELYVLIKGLEVAK